MTIFVLISYYSMFKRYFILVFLFVELVSCETILTNKKDKIIEIESIDFSSIDAYPLLPECEKFTSRSVQKDCFYKFLSKRIELLLSKQNISYSTTKSDTIKVIINVNSKGVISVNPDNLKNSNFKEFIIQSTKGLPKIQPAIKAGIPVTSQFVLPIIIKSE